MAQLNRNELEAMRVLWEKGSLKPAQIQEEFSWPIENATLRSALRLLVEKDLVTRGKRGKAYYYRAKASRRRVLKNMSQRMAHVFTGGSAADLIAQLIKTEKLSKKEIEELRRIAAQKVSDTKS
jgi:BlaI family penicillinase repressor